MFTESTHGDGFFVFRWNKEKDINEPTQKAIILHDQGREDLVLQVKYEGPAEDFGWVIPVPGLPEVRKGSMEPFYELSKLTQKQFGDGSHHFSLGMARAGNGEEPEVKVIEVKTVGAYEIAILSSTNPSALADWLAAHQFNFPKEKQSVLDQYIQRHWFFVAARVNPEGNGFVVKATGAKPSAFSGTTRQKLASGELHPIIISFPSEKCVFPLAISSINGKPSEISLYVLSAEPLASPIVCDRKLKVYESEKVKSVQRHKEFMKTRGNWRASIVRGSPMEERMKAEDPNDPPPDSVHDRPGFGLPEPELFDDAEDFDDPRLRLVQSMAVEGDTNAVKACRHDLPRLKGKQWWLTKVVETFQPEEMVDLGFEPAIPILAERLRRENGEAAAHCLPQFGALAAPTVLQALNDADYAVQRRALPAAGEMSDPRFVEPLLKIMEGKDPKSRVRACHATQNNWDDRFVNALLRLVRDPDSGAANAARSCLQRHVQEIKFNPAELRQMLAEDGPSSMFAVQAMMTNDRQLPREQLVHLLSYTNLATVSIAFNDLRKDITLDELSPLMTNSLPMARMMALGVLGRMSDKPAVDRMVSMLHDPNEAIRWRVRSNLRRATGQKLGADPTAYEKWWAENKDTFTPQPQSFHNRR
jgi:HEAT repeat protein